MANFNSTESICLTRINDKIASPILVSRVFFLKRRRRVVCVISLRKKDNSTSHEGRHVDKRATRNDKQTTLHDKLRCPAYAPHRAAPWVSCYQQRQQSSVPLPTSWQTKGTLGLRPTNTHAFLCFQRVQATRMARELNPFLFSFVSRVHRNLVWGIWKMLIQLPWFFPCYSNIKMGGRNYLMK